MQDVIRISSFGHYLDAIENLRFSKNSDGFIPHIWFRGHPNIAYKLIPSVQRYFSEYSEVDLFERERNLNTDFMSRASTFLETRPEMNDFCSWIQLMQHYGFPTRLLDWSRSPLYALYFATSDRSADEFDGCIWMLNPGLLNKYMAFESNTYIYNMEHGVVKSLVIPAFKHSTHEAKSIVACYATLNKLRVFTQQSAFTVHDTRNKLEDIHTDIYNETGGEMLQRILIPARYKHDIFEQLYSSGITHSNVFPDIEYLAKDIKKQYGIG